MLTTEQLFDHLFEFPPASPVLFTYTIEPEVLFPAIPLLFTGIGNFSILPDQKTSKKLWCEQEEGAQKFETSLFGLVNTDVLTVSTLITILDNLEDKSKIISFTDVLSITMNEVSTINSVEQVTIQTVKVEISKGFYLSPEGGEVVVISL